MTEAAEKAPPRAVLAVTRWLVTAHAVAVFAQPVFAGRYLIGDYDMLALHGFGADLVSYLGLAQVLLSAVLWWRGGPRWPFWVSLSLSLGEFGQYAAGAAGALDVHVPLGVALMTGVSVMAVGIWRVRS